MQEPSRYALLHSSYLATPIHKMPYKAYCSIEAQCTLRFKERETTLKRVNNQQTEKLLCSALLDVSDVLQRNIRGS